MDASIMVWMDCKSFSSNIRMPPSSHLGDGDGHCEDFLSEVKCSGVTSLSNRNHKRRSITGNSIGQFKNNLSGSCGQRVHRLVMHILIISKQLYGRIFICPVICYSANYIVSKTERRPECACFGSVVCNRYRDNAILIPFIWRKVPITIVYFRRKLKGSHRYSPVPDFCRFTKCKSCGFYSRCWGRLHRSHRCSITRCNRRR
nr:MAG TPA: hypothetical protein [Caudoviricetes sp.]